MRDMTFEKTMEEEGDSGVAVTVLVRQIIKKWKTILACGVICALLGVIFAAVTYRPEYTSSISYVINAKNTNGNAAMTQGEFIVAQYMANTYAYVIKSNNLNRRVQAETGLEENISQYVSSSLVEESNIMEVKITTSDAQKSYLIAKAIYECLPELSKIAVSSGSLDVLETPNLALRPNANNSIKKMALFGGLIGLILAVAVITIMHLMRNTVAAPEALMKRIDINHIGSVHHVDIKRKKKGSKVYEPMLITNKKTGFAFGETYKTLRTKIERSAKKNGYKSILITSALENEGKTTVAVNIALTLAQNNNRVILLDCDLRKPATAKVLGVQELIKVQMKDVISGSAVESAVVRLPKFGIDIIGGTDSVENSAEMLSSSGFKKIIEKIGSMYDYVIIDTPPAHLFTDADIMAEYTDASVMVVRQDFAGTEIVVDTANIMAQSKSELMGFIFNDVIDGSVFQAFGKSGYNYSYYGYGNN